jgi:hypothetical protein
MVGILRRLALGVAAALVVGVVCGGVARLLMRVMVVLADEEGSFSLAGTVAIVLTYAVFALPGAVLAAGWGGRGRSALLVLGGLALWVPITGIASSDLEDVLLQGFDIVLVGGAAVGIYVTALAVPLVGLAAVRLLAPGRRTARPGAGHSSPSSSLPIANR